MYKTCTPETKSIIEKSEIAKWTDSHVHGPCSWKTQYLCEDGNTLHIDVPSQCKIRILAGLGEAGEQKLTS